MISMMREEPVRLDSFGQVLKPIQHVVILKHPMGGLRYLLPQWTEEDNVMMRAWLVQNCEGDYLYSGFRYRAIIRFDLMSDALMCHLAFSS